MEVTRAEVLEVLYKYTDKVIGEEDISLIDDLEFDSLQLVSVLAEIEEKFQISFEEGEQLLDMVDHLDEMVEYLKSLKTR